ncbi:MAG: 4-hydroxy-tetrahydrodipicolinate reductase [Candidatus Riflebacteria bacterium]|jgi:4-hydroxy-tetrahydrodipicolinate reductase|nr:4-hydroxy-tetrahydrodipicolinate reductase [Candidatus Riflebacteria bacterium]
MKRKKIAVIGCAGKMGQVVCRYLLSHNNYELAAGIDTNRAGDDLGAVLGLGATGILISQNLQTTISETHIDAAIDFTTPDTVVANAAVCLQAKVAVLIGTTGISQEDQVKLDNLAQKMATGVMIVPNFAIGAILMMDFARKAARFMKSAEIIELHHPQKLDKPSGTAIRTRQNILEELGISDESSPDEVPIHSVRLPGLVAHQEVIFGDIGQTLTIRHDSLNRDSFMPGIGLALEQLHSFTGLRVGLEI